MAERGGYSHKHYWETKGLKVIGNQLVKGGTILTRDDGKWKKGLNVGGLGTLYALCDGRIYFTYRRGRYRTKSRQTFINIGPLENITQKGKTEDVLKTTRKVFKKKTATSKRRLLKEKEKVEL